MKAQCAECGFVKSIHARGLCDRCYRALQIDGSIMRFPRRTQRVECPANLDPYLRWLFAEALAQGRSHAEVGRRAGFSSSIFWNIKRDKNPKFGTFRCLVEALGYEIKLVAKEPGNAPSNENA